MAKKSGPKINAGVCSVSSEATFTCRRRGNRSNMRCCKLQGEDAVGGLAMATVTGLLDSGRLLVLFALERQM